MYDLVFIIVYLFMHDTRSYISVFFLLPASRVWQENPKLPAPVTLFFY